MKKLYFLMVLFVMGSVNAQNPDDIVYIPNSNFKNLLLNSSVTQSVARGVNGEFIKVDINDDAEIQFSELQQVYQLNLEGNTSVSSLEGIKSFLSLEVLECSFGNTPIIDLAGMSSLKSVNCAGANVSTLLLDGLTNLEILDCGYNNLVSLDIGEFTNLKSLKCYNNNLTNLNVSALSNLEYLDFSFNQISNLDLGATTNLEFFSCHNNNLNTLDLSLHSNLQTLVCENTPLTVINIVGLSNLKQIYTSNTLISSLDTQGLASLEVLDVYDAALTSLDLSGLDSLTNLICSNNNIQTLNVSGANALVELNCSFNQISSLDLSGLTNINYLNCSNNQLTSIDLSDLPNLISISTHTNQLESCFMKNGVFDGNLEFYLMFNNNPYLNYICADEFEMETLQYYLTSNGFISIVNSYCSFTPGGTSYTINGTNILDANNNGCDASDISLPNLKFNITDGIISGSILSNQSGEYSIPVQDGTHTITPVLENPTYFNISPTTVEVIFPETTSPFTQNFCITPNGFHQDVDVTIIPVNPAVPGFDSHYKIIYRNLGNVSIAMGTVGLNYNDEVLDFVSANPNSEVLPVGSLFWTFLNLQPFETRTIDVSFNLNSPMETPALNGNDILTFEASADTSVGEDNNPIDNVMNFQQTVVNSFDPNDKTCLEGTSITPDMIGQYVHYMIRFENTGTFAAQNIVVKDMIDTAKFDVSSLIALNGSHPYVTRITGNKVEFIFEGINLPFDDANNDGYVVFKIKTLPTLALGDSFSNTASIYFDFNFPIVTEPAVTTFAELGTEDFEFNNFFTIYPNPTSGVLNITSKQAIVLQTISIYNTLGQLVVSVPNAKGVNNVDVSSLSTGNYFIKVVSDKGTSNNKFVKK